MERRQRGLGRCSMLPISVGLPLILCRKKRPQRRRLEPESARPRARGLSPGRIRGPGGRDPSLSARSPGPASGATAPPGSASGPRPAGRGGREGPQTPGPAPLLPAGRGVPATPSNAPRRRCLEGRCGGPRARPRHAAASVPPATRPHAVGAAPGPWDGPGWAAGASRSAAPALRVRVVRAAAGWGGRQRGPGGRDGSSGAGGFRNPEPVIGL